MSVLCVVEDNELDQRIIKLNLIKYPVFKHTIYFYDGQPLLKYLQENKNDRSNLPDVLLLDLKMPHVDGWKVLDALQVLYPMLCKQIAVYIISASIIPKEINKALSYPFVSDFIAKPLTKDILTAIANGSKQYVYR